MNTQHDTSHGISLFQDVSLQKDQKPPPAADQLFIPVIAETNLPVIPTDEYIIAVMQAIITTSGPVINHQAMKNKFRNKRFNIRNVSSQHYMMAAERLEALSIGSLVTLSHGATLFLKRPPEDVQAILAVSPGICTMDLYAEKYRGPTPACISWKHRSALITEGFVSERFFTHKR